MSEKELGTYEMLWDCRNCDTKKLLGKTHRFCPNCGAAQDPSARYFPSDSEKIAVKDHVFVGADKVCRACDVPNSRAAKHCVACGADLDNAKDAATRSDQVRSEGASFQGETSKDAKKEKEQRKAAAAAPPPKKTGGFKLWPHGAIAFGALFLAFIILAIVWKKEAGVVVTGHSWERTIDVEEFGPKHDSAWCDSMPSDAYRVSRSREVRSHRKVADGQTCSTRRKDSGDGTYREVQECTTKYRDEPVYDYRCSYTVDRWQHDHTERATGASLAQAPTWPPIRLTKTGQCMGCQREGPRGESYVLHVRTDEGKDSSCKFPQAKWQDIKDESRWKMKFAVITGFPDCDSMIPQ